MSVLPATRRPVHIKARPKLKEDLDFPVQGAAVTSSYQMDLKMSDLTVVNPGRSRSEDSFDYLSHRHRD